jgi:hypothetical protein
MSFGNAVEEGGERRTLCFGARAGDRSVGIRRAGPVPGRRLGETLRGALRQALRQALGQALKEALRSVLT